MNDWIDIILHIFWFGGLIFSGLYSYMFKKVKYTND